MNRRAHLWAFPLQIKHLARSIHVSDAKPPLIHSMNSKGGIRGSRGVGVVCAWHTKNFYKNFLYSRGGWERIFLDDHPWRALCHL